MRSAQQWIPFSIDTFEHFGQRLLFLTRPATYNGNPRPAEAFVGAYQPASSNPFLDEDSRYIIEDVTHYAPLPEPPGA